MTTFLYFFTTTTMKVANSQTFGFLWQNYINNIKNANNKLLQENNFFNEKKLAGLFS